MAQDDHKNMKKIQCWVPVSTWEKLEEIGYNSPTVAVLTAFEKLLSDTFWHDTTPSKPAEDPQIIPAISAYEDIVKELRAHNETLHSELEKAERDKEDLKAMYNNYFLQVQTLINQKVIEAPGDKKEEGKKKWWKIW
jgi:hypothetical protein